MTMELMAKLMFALYAAIVLGGGVMAVAAASLVRALVGLILTLFGVAGMYLLMNAPFIALMQLLIYVGAVVVLIFFAIMLTRGGSGGEEQGGLTPSKAALAALGALVPAALLGYVCVRFVPLVLVDAPAEVDITALGKLLMEDYVLAFELISVVLFVAMAGAVLLGFERRRAR